MGNKEKAQIHIELTFKKHGGLTKTHVVENMGKF